MKKTVRIWCLVLGIIVSLPGGLFAQQKTLVRGTISDRDKFPLPQATVIERDKDNRTLSSAVADLDGNFSINMVDVKSSMLVVRYIGFKDRVLKVGDKRVLDIILDDDTQMLEEAVVTAKPKQSIGGLMIDQRDLSMAIGRVNADDIAEVHAASIDDALQGRISGVDIVGSTGDPGGGMSIRVRGLTSINGDNQPLIVVDGIPMEKEVGASSIDFSTATEEEFSQMLNIPPTDIAEIVVLKDAAAAAVWGSRGADGVLVITTKRGFISPPKISFRSTLTISQQPDPIKTLSGYEYSTAILEAMKNAGTIVDSNTIPELGFDPTNPEYYYNYSNNTNWVKELTQTGIGQEYTLSLTGGSKKVRYRFSAGYWDETGITIETGYQRLNTRMNLDYFVSDKLRFSADIAYTHSDQQKHYLPGGDKDLRDKAYTKMPNQGVYYYNERGEKTSQYFTPATNKQGSYESVYNPVAMAREGKNNTRSENAVPKFSLVYDYNSQFRYSTDVSFSILNNKNQQFAPQSATGLPWNDTRVNTALDSDDDKFVIYTNTQARWTPNFADNEKHRLIALLGLTTDESRGNSFKTVTTNLPSAILQDPSIASRVTNGDLSSGFSQRRGLSALANVNYVLMDRYIVYGSIRVDGDSRFGKNYRYGWFPALSGRYRISKESFMSSQKWIDDLSLKASWGVNGRTPSKDYLYYSNYGTYDYNYLGQQAAYPQSLALNNLRWEKTTQTNLGFVLIAFNDRINLEFDYYTKKTKGGLSDENIPSTAGIGKMTMNLNTVENIGWDVNIQSTPYRSKDLTVNFGFNIARSQNYLRKFSEYYNLESGAWNKNGDYLIRLELDQPYGSFYGYKYDGVYLNGEQTKAKDKNGNTIWTINEYGQAEEVGMKFGYPSIGYEFQAGDARYKDINNDGNINLQDVVYLGDYNPLFTGGFGPTIKYKSFTLSSWFYFRYGNDVINMTRMNMEKLYNYDNQSKAVLKRFRNEYPVGTEDTAPSDLLPRALYGKGYNWLGSDRFVEDGSFLRWKTLTFKYNAPRALANTLRLQDLSLWVTLQNLYTWTKYTGQDPEVSISGALGSVGRDYSRAPRAKQFVFGFNLGF
ncbi:SusC/RagA family TonB-linked outer membrane protein [Viscerimonas tarda]